MKADLTIYTSANAGFSDGFKGRPIISKGQVTQNIVPSKLIISMPQYFYITDSLGIYKKKKIQLIKYSTCYSK